MSSALSLSASSTPSSHKTFHPPHLPPFSLPPSLLKFPTNRQESLRYLKAIGVIDPATTKRHKLPSPDATTHLLNTIAFFKSKGFSDADFARLAFVSPHLFGQDFDPTDVEPVFQFLTCDLRATIQESRGLILKCPQLLSSDVEYCLRPTLDYLRKLKVEKLSNPSSLNAHLLNTRAEKLRRKVRFLKEVGLSHKEAARVCARFPAIFGYSIERNLGPKVEYLVKEMERSLEELKEFPQYLAFSFEGRIVPRHLHLKARNVKVKLNRMLLWSDQRFYAKWK